MADDGSELVSVHRGDAKDAEKKARGGGITVSDLIAASF